MCHLRVMRIGNNTLGVVHLLGIIVLYTAAVVEKPLMRREVPKGN